MARALLLLAAACAALALLPAAAASTATDPKTGGPISVIDLTGSSTASLPLVIDCTSNLCACTPGQFDCPAGLQCLSYAYGSDFPTACGPRDDNYCTSTVPEDCSGKGSTCQCHTQSCVGSGRGPYTCTSEGIVYGDPHFVGFNGARFKFDGEPGKHFSLVSTKDVQVNALFSARTMVLKRADDGSVAKSEGGTFITSLGVKDSQGNVASLTLVPAAADAPLAEKVAVTVNGRDIAIASPLSLPSDVKVTTDVGFRNQPAVVLSTPFVQLKAGVIRFAEVDYFAIGAMLPQVSGPVAGVMGELYGAPFVASTNETSWRNVLKGEVADYMVSGLFEADSPLNQYGVATATASRKLIEGRVADVAIPEFALAAGSVALL